MKKWAANAICPVGILLLLTGIPTTQEVAGQAIGIFDAQADIGAPAKSGSASYDEAGQSYHVAGSGYNVWFDRDEFHYVWKRVNGDFILRANARLIGDGKDPHRKLGWMVRSGLDEGDAHVSAALHGDGLAALQFRRSNGGESEEIKSTVDAPDVVQLMRAGNVYTMSVARSGDPLDKTEPVTVDLGDEVYVGLFVTSHDEEAVEEGEFWNVRIVHPAPDTLVPYRQYLGSNLEVLDIETGRRTIVYRHPASIQAPNWTLDGKALIYNGDGLLYRFDLETLTPTVINTDFANRNNNDHVISFDGKRLAISHHSEDHDGQSIVYTVPIEGGVPKLVTPEGPSYLHGWSADDKYLVYTASRGGDYDIYKIPADGGDEIRLTTAPGLDDGPEYTPDGKYIYFNSVRSGRMEIWRMKPDGSEQEQLTDDEFNNWFPHISPDGKQVVFISYGDDVAPSDHPFYKHVYLQQMPLDGGESKVIAYLYGGQGTINVPSWSPDGKRIAF
ncbi:MAG: hypothetical protein R3282_04845, partial [Rhodothermales bacterium]|nr:hypothetical protein [Rhodothermales bacterium]